MVPLSRRKKNAKMGVSATMKAISPKMLEELRGVAHALLDRREQPALVPWLFRHEAPHLRVVADELGLEPVDTDLEGPRQRGKIRDQRRALRAEARSDEGGEQHHEQSEAGEQRGHGHRPAEPESLEPHGERIQEVRQQRGEGDGDDEPAEQEAEPHDGADDREPPERRDAAAGGGGLGRCRGGRRHRRDRDGRR